MKEISVLSLICSCLYPESRKNLLGDFEGTWLPFSSLFLYGRNQPTPRLSHSCRLGHQAHQQAGLGPGLRGDPEALLPGERRGPLHHQPPEEGPFPGGHPEEAGGRGGSEESKDETAVPPSHITESPMSEGDKDELLWLSSSDTINSPDVIDFLTPHVQ